MTKVLILPRIFLGLPIKELGTVESVKRSTIVLCSSGRFIGSICEMWVRIRTNVRGFPSKRKRGWGPFAEELFGDYDRGRSRIG